MRGDFVETSFVWFFNSGELSSENIQHLLHTKTKQNKEKTGRAMSISQQPIGSPYPITTHVSFAKLFSRINFTLRKPITIKVQKIKLEESNKN
jgi:hypothetical protein